MTPPAASWAATPALCLGWCERVAGEGVPRCRFHFQAGCVQEALRACSTTAPSAPTKNPAFPPPPPHPTQQVHGLHEVLRPVLGCGSTLVDRGSAGDGK